MQLKSRPKFKQALHMVLSIAAWFVVAMAVALAVACVVVLTTGKVALLTGQTLVFCSLLAMIFQMLWGEFDGGSHD